MQAGLGCADITSFEPGMLTLGWGDPRGGIDGVDVPLEARALVVGCPRTGRRVALVCADLCFITGLLRSEVMAKLAQRPELELDEGSVMITATHTHSGPGGFSHSLFYSLTTPGVSARVVEALSTGIVSALAQAVERMRPAHLRYLEGPSSIGQPFAWRRSTATPSRSGFDAPTSSDHPMRVLRVDTAGGEPLGLVSFFGLHATCLHGESRRLHPDHKGLSAAMLEHELGGESPPDHPFVALCCQEAAGDVTPSHVFDPVRKIAAGHLPDHDHVEWVARRQADSIAITYRAALAAPVLEAVIDARLRVARFSERTFTTLDGRIVTTTPTTLGLGMALGTDEGRGPLAPIEAGYRVLHRLHGLFRPGDAKVPFVDLAQRLEGRLFGLLPARIALRGPGPQLAALRRMTSVDAPEMPWAPSELPVQILRIGALRIAGIAGEPTLAAGEQVRRVLLAAGHCRHVVTLGYSNDYSSYVTTTAEYAAQNYEGACTLYGPETLSLWCSELAELSAALDRNVAVTSEPAVVPPLSSLTGQGFVAYSRGKGARGGLVRDQRRAPAPWERIDHAPHHDTIVVGAGFAGLCAATRLQRAGQRVLLLEATDRVGGRALSTHDGADLGCGFLGADHVHTLALAAELGLSLVDYCAHVPANPSFRSMTPEGVQDMRLDEAWFGIQGCKKDGPLIDRLGLLRGMLEWIVLENLVNQRAPEAGPLAWALDRITVREWMEHMSLRPRHRDLIRLAVAAIWSTDPERMSLLYLLWYSANNGGLLTICNDQAGGPQQFGVRGGLGGMAEVMANRFRGELRLEAPVTRVERGPTGFRVTSLGGRVHTSNDVIIAAAPAAVARHIAFDPPLPAATMTFLDQPMGHAIKAIVDYDARWWRDHSDGSEYQFFAGRAGGVLEWMLDVSEPDRGVFRFVAFLRARSRDDVAETLLTAMKAELLELTGDPRCLDVRRFDCFDWSRNRFVGGGPVTFCTPGVLTGSRQREACGGVHFAGAEYSDQFTGYVEGAVRSGARAAARILGDRPDASLRAPGLRWPNLVVAAAAYVPVAAALGTLRAGDDLSKRFTARGRAAAGD